MQGSVDKTSSCEKVKHELLCSGNTSISVTVFSGYGHPAISDTIFFKCLRKLHRKLNSGSLNSICDNAATEHYQIVNIP